METGLGVGVLGVPGDALLLTLKRGEDRRAHLVRVRVRVRARVKVRVRVRVRIRGRVRRSARAPG